MRIFRITQSAAFSLFWEAPTPMTPYGLRPFRKAREIFRRKKTRKRSFAGCGLWNGGNMQLALAWAPRHHYVTTAAMAVCALSPPAVSGDSTMQAMH